jgi:hypothetical protein
LSEDVCILIQEGGERKNMKSTFFKKGVLKRGLATVMTAAMLAVESLGAPGLAGVLTVQAAETTVDDASANVAFAEAEAELKVGEEKDFALNVTEYDASSNAIKFKSLVASSSNEEVATVAESGKTVTVTAVAVGQATITATAEFVDASANSVVKKATLTVNVTEEEKNEEETEVAEDSEIVVDVTEGIAVTADSKSARIATVAFKNFTDADVADAENNHVEFAFDKALAEKFSVEASVNAATDAKPVNVNVKVSGQLAEDVYNGTLTVTKFDGGVKDVETYDVEIAYTESKASEIKLILSGVTGKVDLQGNYKDAAQVATAKFTAETKNGTPVPVEELVLCDGNKSEELNLAKGTFAIAAVDNGEISSSVKGATMDLAFYPTKGGKPANDVNTKGLAKKPANFGKAWNTVYVAAKYTFVNEKGEAETVLTQPVAVANLKNTKSKLKADKINVAALKNKDASLNVALTNKKVVTTYDLAGDSYILQYKGKDKKWTDDASANGAKVLYEEGNHVTLPVGRLYEKVGKNSVTARLVAFDSATGRVFPNQVINIKIAYKNKAKSYKVAPSVKTLTLNSDKKYNDASTNIVIDLKSNGAAIQSVKLDESKSSLKSISAKKGLKYSFDASSNKLTIVPGEIAGDKKYTNKLVFTLDASNNAVAFKDVKITVKTTNKPVKTTAKVKGKINTLLLTDASINDASKNNVVYVIPKLSNTYVSAYGEAGFSKSGKFVVTAGSYKGKFAYVVKAVSGASLDKTTDLVAEGFYFYADGTKVVPTKAKVKASGATAKIKVFNYKGKKAGKQAKNPVLEVKDASFNRVDASYNGVAYVFMTYEKAVPAVEKITTNNPGVKVELIQTAASKSIGAVTVRILVKEGTVLKPGKANKVKVTFPSKLTTKVKKVTFKLLDKRTAKAADKNKK